ncbi:hypothetical protein [Streptomyces sp. NPDC006784]|uniref:hypothetical protein n=1 Tax=Streptomyces sp. NPDC006784 TaxID=3364764 RepID=UPI00367DD89D
MKFGITVHQLDERGRIVDLALYEQAADAPSMEDRVTELHREYPAPHFRTDVESLKPLFPGEGF